MSEFLYRYDDDYGPQSDEDFVDPTVTLKQWAIVRTTECTAVIRGYFKSGYIDIVEKTITEKTYMGPTRKRYAYRTKEEAMESYLIRKRRQIMHLESRLEYAKKRLELAENGVVS